MNRRQLFKKIAGIVGAVLAAPVMAKEIAPVVKRSPIKPSDLIDFDALDRQLTPRGFLIERKKFVEFPSSPVQGEMFYGPDGNLWVFDERWWKVIGQYDTLDGQHGSYYTSTH